MHQTLARIDAELAQFVSWDGRSGDAASSSAADLDDERGPCAECGYDPGDCDGLHHDAWSAEHTDCALHDYAPAPEPYRTGEFLIAREDLWQCDGYLTWPEADDPNADMPGWGVAEVWQRDGDSEWWPEWLEGGADPQPGRRRSRPAGDQPRAPPGKHLVPAEPVVVVAAG